MVPYVYNFQEVYDLLKSYGMAEKVNNENRASLNEIIKILTSPIVENHQHK